MAARNKPYEQFGPYILFKRIDSDALGDLWRAGKIEEGRVASTVALRRLSAGDRAALSAAAMHCGAIVPQLSGTSFARGQAAGVVDGIPFLSWEYSGGRTLRHVMDRARGGRDVPPQPLPLDQAIAIAEKVALSLATMNDFRDSSGARLSHGALLPQFVWIGDDGEIRVAGQQLGPGIAASLADPQVSAELAAYFSPESRSPGKPAKPGDVYSMGAVLFLLVTGSEPPDAASASAFGAAVRAAKTMLGTPLPDDIRVVLDKSFNIDPSMRYPSITEMKQALSALASGGRYSATTFNLAFYLSSLLKKELEAEALEREKESKVNVAPYLEVRSPSATAEEPHAAAPTFASATELESKKSRLPLMVAAAVVVAAAGVGGWMMLRKPATAPAATATAAHPAAPRPAQPVISEPIVASATPAPATTDTAATGTASDAETQKKAFEEAVRQKLQAELMKLQDDYMAELKRGQSKNAPVAAAPAPVAAAQPAEERPAVTAAQLDQQRRDQAPRPEATPAQSAPAPVQQQPAPAATQPAAVPAARAAAPAVREGDVVDVAALDALPRPLRAIAPGYPPMARQQRVEATVFMTVLVTETGEVAEVKVLKGEARFGMNDAAVRAMRATRFSPPMKDGKRVRTWFPQTIEFRP